MSRPKPPPKTLLDWLGVRQAPDWSVARPLGGLLALLLGLLFLGALAAAMVLLVRTIGGAEGSLGTGALIVALLSAPFLIWNTVIRHRALEFQKEGHLTDRLAKAVEQLGAEKTVKKDGVETTEPNLEVRIGGLLSLERIAQDSTAYDKGRDHVRVMEIICAYIRNNAPASDAVEFPLGDLDPLPDDATPEQRETHLAYVKLRGHEGGNLRDWFSSRPGPREDIMLALRILERRSDKQRRIEAAHGRDDVIEVPWVFAEPCPELPELTKGEPYSAEVIESFKTRIENWRGELSRYDGYRPDLRRICLQGADLSRFRLAGVRLDGARLDGTDFSSARLEGVELTFATLEGVLVTRGRLEGVKFSDARLDGASLGHARLIGAELKNASLKGAGLAEASGACAFFGWAQLVGASLKDAKIEGADFRVAKVSSATLQAVRAEHAIFAGAKLEGAQMSGAWLQGAVFVASALNGAVLRGARLQGTNFGGTARLNEAFFCNVQLDAETNFIGTPLYRAAFQDVDLTNVSVMQRQVENCFGDASVSLPDGISRPSHWVAWELKEKFQQEWVRWRGDPDNYRPRRRPNQSTHSLPLQPPGQPAT